MLNHDTLRGQTKDVLSRLGIELPPGAGQRTRRWSRARR